MRVMTTGLIGVALLAVLATGCTDRKLGEKVESLEKRVADLEKRPSTPPRMQPPAPQKEAYDLPVAHSYVRGNKDAPITLTVFTDHQCPFCSRVEPFLEEVLKDPELKDKVKLVFKLFPLTSIHPNALPAAKAALAAGEQGRFWEMSDKLFQNQGSLNSENYEKWAKELGLNVTKFKKDLVDNDSKYEETIKNDIALGTNVAKVQGTPTLYVGGWKLSQRSVDAVKNLIREKNLTTN